MSDRLQFLKTMLPHAIATIGGKGLNMSPSSFQMNQTNSSLRYTKSIGNYILKYMLIEKFPDFQHVTFLKFCKMIFLAAIDFMNSRPISITSRQACRIFTSMMIISPGPSSNVAVKRMVPIFNFSKIFKIIRAVVRGIVVLMVDFLSIWTHSNERQGDKTMNRLDPPFTFAEKENIKIVFPRIMRFEENSGLPVAFRKTLYASMIRRFIISLITRNCFPDFLCGIIRLVHGETPLQSDLGLGDVGIVLTSPLFLAQKDWK